ncbi:unnamed protein product [Paramecium primaurelia]|uniref:RING-type domain-containing protein n=1 Tax=Paramecium primaurelia TaxID=5886 RepID=A0A8S1PEQ0_PARPR|nr:unnamed protein product [Paramecium primaurelia]
MYCDSISDGLVALGVFDGSLGIVSLVLTIMLEGTQEKIYTIMCTITEFWWIWLIVSIIYKKLSVGVVCSVKEVLMLPDYQFSRYVAAILSLLQFTMTICLLNSDDIKRFTGEMLALAMLVPVFCFFKGIALIFVLIQQIFLIFTGKEKNHYFTLIQDQQSKKQVIFLGIVFLIMTSLYYFLKSLFVFTIYNNFDDLNTKIFTIMIIIQSLFLIIFSSFMTCQLITILKQIPVNEDPHLINPNQKCYQNWFILIKSIYFSDKMKWLRRITYFFWCIQCIYGLIQFPFFKIIQITQQQLYTQTSFMYFDTFLLQGLIVTQIILQMAKKFHQIQDDEDPFLFNIKFSNEDSSKVEKKQKIIDKSQLQCGICLEDLKVGQIRQKLTCHETHIFHLLCIQKWTQTQNICPICRTPCD